MERRGTAATPFAKEVGVAHAEGANPPLGSSFHTSITWSSLLPHRAPLFLKLLWGCFCNFAVLFVGFLGYFGSPREFEENSPFQSPRQVIDSYSSTGVSPSPAWAALSWYMIWVGTSLSLPLIY
ncbi:unnamed protein product [Ilex paraguariensis]|uniref:Uncharacterized protein n=1 Tax=Ilex paraguariensis TaxID=185542 RepID=A0ABC8R3V9_9AQUA